MPTIMPAASPSRDQRWFELVLVLFIAFGSSFINSLFIMVQGPGTMASQQATRMASGILHEIICLALLGYILFRRGKKIRDLGLNWSILQVFTGLGLAVVAYIVYTLVGYLIYTIQRHLAIPESFHTPLQIFGHATWMMLLYSCINPFFEELIVRAYLMTELRELTGSWTIAVTASALIQASYHLYYGWSTATAIFFQFLVFSIYFARSRKATPLITAHAIFDLWSAIRMW